LGIAARKELQVKRKELLDISCKLQEKRKELQDISCKLQVKRKELAVDSCCLFCLKLEAYYLKLLLHHLPLVPRVVRAMRIPVVLMDFSASSIIYAGLPPHFRLTGRKRGENTPPCKKEGKCSKLFFISYKK
jgi:hypothetical protein